LPILCWGWFIISLVNKTVIPPFILNICLLQICNRSLVSPIYFADRGILIFGIIKVWSFVSGTDISWSRVEYLIFRLQVSKGSRSIFIKVLLWSVLSTFFGLVFLSIRVFSSFFLCRLFSTLIFASATAYYRDRHNNGDECYGNAYSDNDANESARRHAVTTWSWSIALTIVITIVILVPVPICVISPSRAIVSVASSIVNWGCVIRCSIIHWCERSRAQLIGHGLSVCVCTLDHIEAGNAAWTLWIVVSSLSVCTCWAYAAAAQILIEFAILWEVSYSLPHSLVSGYISSGICGALDVGLILHENHEPLAILECIISVVSKTCDQSGIPVENFNSTISSVKQPSSLIQISCSQSCIWPGSKNESVNIFIYLLEVEFLAQGLYCSIRSAIILHK
jgi:hypothetical protein